MHHIFIQSAVDGHFGCFHVLAIVHPWSLRETLASQASAAMAKTERGKRHAAAAKSLQSYLTLRPHSRQPTRLHCPWDSPGKSPGVGCHCLLQEEAWAVGIKQCFWACGRDPQAMQVAMRPGGRCCPEDQRWQWILMTCAGQSCPWLSGPQHESR